MKPILARNLSLRLFGALCLCGLVFLQGSCLTQSRSVQVKSEPEETHERDARQSLVNINTASQDELEKLPGIGPGMATRIIEHRERYGPFRRAEHLIMVRGLSHRRFRAMRPFVAVG